MDKVYLGHVKWISVLKLTSVRSNNMFSLDFAINFHLQCRYVNRFKIAEGQKKGQKRY